MKAPAKLAPLALLVLATCGGPTAVRSPYEGTYGVLCLDAYGGHHGIRLEFEPQSSTPGADLVVCDGACVRPLVVAIQLRDADLTFDTRDAAAPQDGVSVAAERHWTAAFDEGMASLEGQGDGYSLPAVVLKKDDRTCPVGMQPAEPAVALPP